MKIDYFETHEDLSEYMVDKALDGVYTVAVLFYEDAIKLAKELMLFEDISVVSLEISPSDWNDYDKEYIVSLNGELNMAVEPAYVDGRYLDAEADLTLIDGEASSAIIMDLPREICREIYIGKKEDEESEIADDSSENTSGDCVCSIEDIETKGDNIFGDIKAVRNKNGKIIGVGFDVGTFFNYLFE